MAKNWFTVKQLFPDIWGIGEFDHFQKVISYLFVGKTRALLFDTGMGIGDIQKEVSQITSLPISVINSHSHYDHVGGNKKFSQILHPIDGNIISVAPFAFTLLETPGHTPDSICLYELKKKILLTGDTMYPGPIYLFFPESNFEVYKKSIKKLSKLDVDMVLPGHNAFLQDKEILSMIKEKIEHKIKPEDKIQVNPEVSLLSRNPVTES